MTEQENLAGVTGGFAKRLAQLLGVSVNAPHIFGAPVEREGLTVIPVARAAYGFGGGSGGWQGEEAAGGSRHRCARRYSRSCPAG